MAATTPTMRTRTGVLAGDCSALLVVGCRSYHHTVMQKLDCRRFMFLEDSVQVSKSSTFGIILQYSDSRTIIIVLVIMNHALAVADY